MNLKDYNLEVVTIDEKMFRLRPISDCIINGRKYIYDSNEKDEEKIYIPKGELIFGCVMSVQNQEKSWIIRTNELFWTWYIEIYEVPYKKNADYLKSEIFEFILMHVPNNMFPVK